MKFLTNVNKHRLKQNKTCDNLAKYSADGYVRQIALHKDVAFRHPTTSYTQYSRTVKKKK